MVSMSIILAVELAMKQITQSDATVKREFIYWKVAVAFFTHEYSFLQQYLVYVH